MDDVRAALGKLAAAYRQDFNLPVIAVGGSNGKTTTKELIASVLRQKLATLWSEASFNNDIGVPLTLLRLEKSHQAAVLEAGTNHPGELAPLVKMIRPKFGVMTNIGREHLEFFGDVAGVAQEEGWLAELLPADGKLFMNGDNEWTEQIVRRGRSAKVVRVGFGEKNDWRADKVRLDKNGVTFRVRRAEGRILRRVPDQFAGPASGDECACLRLRSVRNSVWAALKSSAAWPNASRRKCGCSFGKRTACACWTTPTTRTRIRCSRRWKRLCDLPLQGRRVAVLGDMDELGAHSEAAHAEVGRRAAELGNRPVVRRRQNGAGHGAGGARRGIEPGD